MSGSGPENRGDWIRGTTPVCLIPTYVYTSIFILKLTLSHGGIGDYEWFPYYERGIGSEAVDSPQLYHKPFCDANQ